jgi:lambda family phage portal protein
MGWRDVFRNKKHAPRRRGFEGAAGSRLFNDFLSSSRSADGELRYSLKTLRERARELSRNNDYARRFIQLLLTNVIGPDGIGFQNRARDDSFALDQAANNSIESRWKDWGRQGVCTVDGRMTWLDAQRLFMETLARDGEVMVRLVRGWKDNEYGFAIQFVEADLLDEENNAERKDGSAIRMGVETDRYGKPIAYHMATKHPGDDPQGFTPSGSERVDARDMLHIFKIERAGQSRGIPPLAVAMTDLQMLGKYLEAELVARREPESKHEARSMPYRRHSHFECRASI